MFILFRYSSNDIEIVTFEEFASQKTKSSKKPNGNKMFTNLLPDISKNVQGLHDNPT